MIIMCQFGSLIVINVPHWWEMLVGERLPDCVGVGRGPFSLYIVREVDLGGNIANLELSKDLLSSYGEEIDHVYSSSGPKANKL